MNMAHLFNECLAYAMKKQAIQDVYKGKDIFVWFRTLQGMESQFA